MCKPHVNSPNHSKAERVQYCLDNPYNFERTHPSKPIMHESSQPLLPAIIHEQCLTRYFFFPAISSSAANDNVSENMPSSTSELSVASKGDGGGFKSAKKIVILNNNPTG